LVSIRNLLIIYPHGMVRTRS